jgi:poly-gamma-glutamate capsule biosynthesis protein CapA/YwtB (metallophosphatase superfamily)
MNCRKLIFFLVILTPLLISAEVIENFDSGTIILLSYPGEDIQPNAWALDSINTYNNSPFSLKLYGNTWKIDPVDSIKIDTNDVWQIASFIERLGEIQGFGLMDSTHTLFYSFAGTEQLNVENWVTVYQGAFPLDTWNIYRLPIGEDWLNWFGYLPTITGIVFINDRDTDTSATVYFDEISDITNDLPIAPKVEISDSVGEILVNALGNKSVSVHFYSQVIDPDSDHHDYFWYFGDDSTSQDSNPVHTYIIGDDHEYTVLLEVVDSTGLWGRANCQVRVDPGPSTYPVTVNFVGDIMLARRYESPGGVIDTLGVEGIFDPTLPYLGNAAEITVANLECPLTTHGTRHPTKPIVFRSQPANVAGLVHAGIDVVSLANNHIIDYGLPGLCETESVLTANNILYSGAGANSYEANQPLFRLKSGVNLGFLAYSDRTGQYNNYQPYLNAGFNKPGFANLDTFCLNEQINNIRNIADRIITEMHAGNEYSPDPRPMDDANGDEFYSPIPLIPCTSDINVRHKAIEYGADLAICHHPHMLQGFEVYQGKLIAHSLGNFAFDLDYPETYPTVILNGKIDATGFFDFTVLPVYIDDYIPRPAKGELGIHILDYLVQRSKELGTYLIVHKDSLTAQIILDTNSLNPIINLNHEEVRLQPDSSYWCSQPLQLLRNGSISSVTAISPASNWQVRLGRDLNWLWCGNFENEGSSLWLINQADEFYDTIAFAGQRSLCQVRSAGTTSIITNLEERIPCYSDSTYYTLYCHIKTQNADSSGLIVRCYQTRTAGLLGSRDLDTLVSGNTDWSFYFQEFKPAAGTKFFDINLRSTAPESSQGYTWFDNVGVIQWENWLPLDSLLNIPVPNDFYWIQIRTDESTKNAQLSYEETDYNSEVRIVDNKPNKLFVHSFQSYPNPVKTSAIIQYNLIKSGRVVLTIYNSIGQKIKTLVNGFQSKGQKNLFWNGTNNQGKPVGSGIYFCRLKVEHTDQSQKIILLK